MHNGGDAIPPAAQASIFEPLARGGSDGTQSIGLGLFIARAIVTAHGGEIRVRSPEVRHDIRSGPTQEVGALAAAGFCAYAGIEL